MATQTDDLSRESLGHLNYFRALMTQPRDAWDGFYQSLSPSMNFALRYQLAFSTYALAALAQKTPAYRAPYVEALTGAIEKMLSVETWGYWRVPRQDGAASEGGGARSSGHVAVLVSPHQRVAAGPPSDPIAQDNLQYSGHLSTMLGLFEKLSSDDRYDQPFTLLDPDSGTSYRYTHSEVAARIYDQMRKNNFGGVCCEKGMAYVPCNNHALASNTLHDALHGTHYSRDNARWLRTVRDKLVLKGPALRGVFGTAYMKDFKLATPVAFNFTDAWGLAFMLPFDRPLVRKLYGKFKKRGVTRAGSDGAYISSSTVSERMEISDVPINTGFGLVLARGIGDMALATDLHRYSAGAFDAGWDGNRYFYKGAPRTAHATALYALASTIEPGGASFAAMFNGAVDPAARSNPYLAEVDASGEAVGVAKAEYDVQEKTLTLSLCQVGAPDALRAARPVEAVLTIGNITTAVHIELDGVPLGEHEYSRHGDTLRIATTVSPAHHTRCVVRSAA